MDLLINNIEATELCAKEIINKCTLLKKFLTDGNAIDFEEFVNFLTIIPRVDISQSPTNVSKITNIYQIFWLGIR